MSNSQSVIFHLFKDDSETPCFKGEFIQLDDLSIEIYFLGDYANPFSSSPDWSIPCRVAILDVANYLANKIDKATPDVYSAISIDDCKTIVLIQNKGISASIDKDDLFITRQITNEGLIISDEELDYPIELDAGSFILADFVTIDREILIPKKKDYCNVDWINELLFDHQMPKDLDRRIVNALSRNESRIIKNFGDSEFLYFLIRPRVSSKAIDFVSVHTNPLAGEFKFTISRKYFES